MRLNRILMAAALAVSLVALASACSSDDDGGGGSGGSGPSTGGAGGDGGTGGSGGTGGTGGDGGGGWEFEGDECELEDRSRTSGVLANAEMFAGVSDPEWGTDSRFEGWIYKLEDDLVGVCRHEPVLDPENPGRDPNPDIGDPGEKPKYLCDDVDEEQQWIHVRFTVKIDETLELLREVELYQEGDWTVLDTGGNAAALYRSYSDHPPGSAELTALPFGGPTLGFVPQCWYKQRDRQSCGRAFDEVQIYALDSPLFGPFDPEIEISGPLKSGHDRFVDNWHIRHSGTKMYFNSNGPCGPTFVSIVVATYQ